MVAEGRGKDLLLMPGWWYVISAESFLDRMTEMPDTLELAPRVTCPVLYLRGDKENRRNLPRRGVPGARRRAVRGADHSQLRSFL